MCISYRFGTRWSACCSRCQQPTCEYLRSRTDNPHWCSNAPASGIAQASNFLAKAGDLPVPLGHGLAEAGDFPIPLGHGLAKAGDLPVPLGYGLAEAGNPLILFKGGC